MEREKGGWVYIMTNAAHGTLYIGVTAHLAERVTQHREGRGSEFCAEHALARLVYAERYGDIREAIAREKAMKRWKRAWKLRLICAQNPHWRDLYADLVYLQKPSQSRRPCAGRGPSQPSRLAVSKVPWRWT